MHCNNGCPYDAVCAEQDLCKLLVEAQKCWPSWAITRRPKSHSVHLYPLKLPFGPPLVKMEMWDNHFQQILDSLTPMLEELQTNETECPDFLLMNQEPAPKGWFVKENPPTPGQVSPDSATATDAAATKRASQPPAAPSKCSSETPTPKRRCTTRSSASRQDMELE